MNSVIPMPSRNNLTDNYRSMSDEQLIQELARLTFECIETIWKASAVVAEAERRGINLRKFRYTLIPYLKCVWEGTMLPDVIAHFIPKEYLIPIVGKMPTDEQQRLSEGGRVEAVVIGPNPETELYAIRMVDPLDPTEMPPAMEAQVIDRKAGRIRSPREQVAILDEQRKEASKPLPVKVGNLTLDVERGGAEAHGWVSWADMEAALQYRRKR